MKKREFLEILEKNLQGLREEDIKEIIEDYEEHFRIGKKNKRSEKEISNSLGDPREIAKDAKRELGEVNNFKKDLRNIGKIVEETANNFYNNFRNSLKSNTKEDKVKQNTNKKSNFWRAFGLFSLDFLLIIWIFLSLYVISFSFFVAGGAIVFSGFITFIISIFFLIVKTSGTLNYLAISGIFAGIFLISLGIIWFKFTKLMTKGFSWILNKYIKWHKGVLKK